MALLGDGTFGFHAMKLDTALRHQLPFIAVVGNDAAWNAEVQIQRRHYGADRVAGCQLLPTRDEQLAGALGGHGAQLAAGAELAPARPRIQTRGRPARTASSRQSLLTDR